jgi:hypothetical protein
MARTHMQVRKERLEFEVGSSRPHHACVGASRPHHVSCYGVWPASRLVLRCLARITSRVTVSGPHHVPCRGDLRSPFGRPSLTCVGTNRFVRWDSAGRNAPPRGGEPTRATAGRPYTRGDTSSSTRDQPCSAISCAHHTQAKLFENVNFRFGPSPDTFGFPAEPRMPLGLPLTGSGANTARW